VRNVAIVVALVVVGLVAYNFMSGGDGPLSDDQAKLKDLEYRFAQAREQMSAAGRGAGLTGIDTSSDAESARLEIDRILESAQTLAREAEGETRAKAEKLVSRLREYRSGLR
jgi:hypothetical protein